MNHHDNPFDMSGPEFEGLSFDEAFDLKRQLRIRDRNHRLSERDRNRRKRAMTRAIWITPILIFILAATVLFGIFK